MKIKGQFQWTDYLAAQLLHAQPSGSQKIIQYVAYTFVALIFVAVLYLFFRYGGKIENVFPIILFILAVIFPIFYRKVFMPNQVKKSFEQQKGMSLPFEFEFTETGMLTSNKLGNNTLPWEYFTKWKENEDIIILYQSDSVIHMLPKRLFANPEELEVVKSLLEKNKVTKVTSSFRQNETGYNAHH